jgi:phosphoglycerate dehydrogenase-like enzyme
MLDLALPARVREIIEPECAAVGHLHWYADFDGACASARVADAMWLSPALYDRARLDQMLDGAVRLRWLHVSLTGVEEFPLDVLAARGVQLTNGAGLRADAVAEYVLMVLLAVARGLPGMVLAQAQQRWDPGQAHRNGLAGKELLVIGYGHVGRAISRVAAAVGMKVTAARRTPSTDPGVLSGATWRAVLPKADYVILAVPSTTETRGMIGVGELGAMKPSAVLINAARGDLVDHPALLNALASGRIGGAVLDCFLRP